MKKILQGDSIEVLKTLDSESVDCMVTDPPYGYSFMGKDWDKAVPSVEVWKECLRVLKPGAFAFVMSAPRSDVQMHMIKNLNDAGFRVDFTPIYWTFASGFPKAGNIGKLVDKRLGNEHKSTYIPNDLNKVYGDRLSGGVTDNSYEPKSTEAKQLDGSYAGFQPKPAVEVIIVAMKPLSEKTYVDQALKNGKGITWLDDVRIPTETPITYGGMSANSVDGVYRDDNWQPKDIEKKTVNGRFPANLLVSDDVLNDGVDRKSPSGNVNRKERAGNVFTGETSGFDSENNHTSGFGDSGSYSRYFDLDKWANQLPFLITPKASKSEKNKGLDHMEDKILARSGGAQGVESRDEEYTEAQGIGINRVMKVKNNHPTVKPLKLMSYLITLGSRPNDLILDPFVGSGTTCIAARELGRNYIGIELDKEYVEIAEARLSTEYQPALL